MSPVILLFLNLAVSPSQGAPPVQPATHILHDEIVVTASGVAEPVSETPVAATVITREDIEERAALEVSDVLREVPGLTVVRTGSAGKVASLFTRGGSSKHTLVMWNGVEINNPQFSGFDWGRMSTAGVERVEVVRGPFSALYGSDAVTGVVHVISSPDQEYLNADMHAGERGLVGGRVAGATRMGSRRLSGALEHREDDGFRPNDDAEQSSVVGEAQWSSAGWSIGARGRWLSYDTGIPSAPSTDFTRFEPRSARREDGFSAEIMVPVSYRRGTDTYQLTLSQAGRRDEFEDPQDPFGFTWASTDAVTRRALATAILRRGNQTLIAGGELEDARVDDETAYGPNLQDHERSATSLFLEDRLSIPLAASRWEVSAGVRWDRFDTFGSEISPRLAAAWIAGNNKLRAGYGRAFRAPAVGELYYPFFGNEALEPERSWSAELGWERALRRGRFAVTLFHTDFDEQIVYDGLTNRFENTGAGVSEGVELGWSAQLSDALGWSLSYTWLDTEDEDTGGRFLRRPEHSGSIGVSYARGGWSATAVALHTGNRLDVTDLVPFGVVNGDAYTVMDLTLARTFGTFEPYLRVQNLLDEDYQEASGYPSPGRRAMVGVRMKLR